MEFIMIDPKGRLYSGSTSVSHTEGPGFDSLPLHSLFDRPSQLLEWPYVPPFYEVRWLDSTHSRTVVPGGKRCECVMTRKKKVIR
jgi:hypothetical protein